MPYLEPNTCSALDMGRPVRTHDEFVLTKNFQPPGKPIARLQMSQAFLAAPSPGGGEERAEVKPKPTVAVAPLHSMTFQSLIRMHTPTYWVSISADGYISAGRRGVWCMRITLDTASPSIVEACAVALEATFPAKTARRGQRRGSRCVDVSMWSKHWPCFFPQHGPGRKHLRPIRLAPWQEEIVAANRKSLARSAKRTRA